jgi:hypothetical protein
MRHIHVNTASLAIGGPEVRDMAFRISGRVMAILDARTK